MGKIAIIVTKNPQEAKEAYLNYTEKTGLYARIVTQTVQTGDDQKPSRTYVVYGYDEQCRLGNYLPNMTHDGLRILAGMYLRLTKLRVALDLMSRHPTAPKVVSDVMRIVNDEKRDMLRIVRQVIEPHPITQWCNIISAGNEGTLGASAALAFLGYIDPHEAPTAGRAKKHWGYYPGGKLRRGAKADFDPRLKGVGHFIAERVVMGRDSYYRPLFDAKKEYYTNRGDKGAHGKALFWLAALLISNAQQILRESEGYPVARHRLHIEPKKHPDEEPPASIVEAIRTGAVTQYWAKKE